MIKSIKDQFKQSFSIWDMQYPGEHDVHFPPGPYADLSKVVVHEFSYAPLNGPGPHRRYRIFWNVTGPTDAPWSLSLFNSVKEPLNNPLPLIGEAETQPTGIGRYVLKATSHIDELVLGLFDIEQNLDACNFTFSNNFSAFLYWYFSRQTLVGGGQKYFDGDPMDCIDISVSQGLVSLKMALRAPKEMYPDPHVDVECRFGFDVVDDPQNPPLKRVNIFYHSFQVKTWYTPLEHIAADNGGDVLARTKRQMELDMDALMTRLETFGPLGLGTPPGYSLYDVALLNVDGTTLRKRYCPLPRPEAIKWDKVLKSKIHIKAL
jgi:hypothetical protein